VDFYEKLWYYCPRPIRHRTHLITRLAIALHIPSLRHRKPKVPVFGLLSLIISITLYVLGAYVLVGLITGSLGGIMILIENPVLLVVSFFAFFFLWIFIDWFLEQTRKNRSKTLFVALSLLILLPILFSDVLANGLFDSISLTNDSRIDLYNGTIDLFMKNIGIIDVRVTNIQVGSLTFGFNFMLRRGETERLSIRYTDNQYVWNSSAGVGDSYYPGVPMFHLSAEVSPTTFEEGKYPVLIHTDGLFTGRYEISAGFSRNENVSSFVAYVTSLNQYRVGEQDFCSPDITFCLQLHNASAYVYSVDIGNLTVRFDPPILLDAWWTDREHYMFDSFTLSTANGYVNGWNNPRSIPNQPFNSPLFHIGETYDITLRTIANNNYTTSMTMKKLP